jgi:hypothetical protein
LGITLENYAAGQRDSLLSVIHKARTQMQNSNVISESLDEFIESLPIQMIASQKDPRDTRIESLDSALAIAVDQLALEREISRVLAERLHRRDRQATADNIELAREADKIKLPGFGWPKVAEMMYRQYPKRFDGPLPDETEKVYFEREGKRLAALHRTHVLKKKPPTRSKPKQSQQ